MFGSICLFVFSIIAFIIAILSLLDEDRRELVGGILSFSFLGILAAVVAYNLEVKSSISIMEPAYLLRTNDLTLVIYEDQDTFVSRDVAFIMFPSI